MVAAVVEEEVAAPFRSEDLRLTTSLQDEDLGLKQACNRVECRTARVAVLLEAGSRQ